MNRELHFSDLDQVYISRESLASPVGERVRTLLPQNKWQVIESEAEIHELRDRGGVTGELTARQFDRSKKVLLLTPFKGQFFKRCPGARPGLTCCNYFVLNLGQQCNMNCTYCYLQSFINSPVMKMYSNIDQAMNELRELGQTHSETALRVGTGEVIDSLSLDPLSHYSIDLIKLFREFPKWRLEFKTKSSYVDQFLDVDHAENVIVSFSINPQNIIEREEFGTASLEARLNAARRAGDRKFLISFHLDPVIYHPEWRESYSGMVRKITEMFKPSEIPVMSVGALRFQPQQRHLMRERFGMNSLVNRSEMFPGSDGKLRYDQSLREEMFQHILNEFSTHSKEWKIFLCMETPETWLGAVGKMPKSVDGLAPLFEHKRVSQNFSTTAFGN